AQGAEGDDTVGSRTAFASGRCQHVHCLTRMPSEHPWNPSVTLDAHHRSNGRARLGGDWFGRLIMTSCVTCLTLALPGDPGQAGVDNEIAAHHTAALFNARLVAILSRTDGLLVTAAGTAHVRIFLLGRFEVRVGDAVAIDRTWSRRKARTLLGLLAVQATRA